MDKEQNNGCTLLQITASPALRVRSGPGTGYAKSGSLKQGQTVQADQLQDGWYHLADGSGWICGKFTAVLQTGTAVPADRLAALERRVTAIETILGGQGADTDA